MNPSPAFSAANGTGSNLQTGNTVSATWINKLKIVGRGQNWAVAPCEPFYLMGTEPPAPDAALTGAKNLIEHYGLENAYQKFCGKRLREELNAFLPHLSGNIDVPASVDESGLMSLIERPPIRGKELRPFAPSQLDHAFRLHPGPLPQEYASLFAAAPSKHIHRSVQDQQQLMGSNGTGTRVPATAVPGLSSSGSFHRRRRRHEVHRGALASGSDSSSSIGVPGVGGVGSGNVSASPASFFTGAPTAYPQLGAVHTTASLSSKSMVSQSHTLSSSLSITTSAPCTNVTMSNQSSNALDNNPVTQVVNHSKLVDHPPGLIPVSAPHSHLLGSSISTSSSSSEPPPPPLLAPIHHHSNQKLPHSIQNTSSTLNPLYNSNTIDVSLTPNKSVPPAPPVLHSIHPPSINPINSSVPSQPPSHQFHHYRHQQQQQLSSHLHHHQHPLSSVHHHHPIASSHSYPSSLSQNSSRSMSPIPMETNSSSPQSPDIYKIRRLDMTDEERRKKKRREKKRRKDKE